MRDSANFNVSSEVIFSTPSSMLTICPPIFTEGKVQTVIYISLHSESIINCKS